MPLNILNNTTAELPKGWAWTELKDCVDIFDSQRVPINAKEREHRIIGKPRSKLYPYYGATGQVGWIDDYLFDEELVLLGEDGAPFLDFTKAKAYIIRGKTWVNNHAHVLRAILGLTTNQFICHFLNQFDFHGYVTGTTRHKLNQAPMRRIPLPIAPLPEQKRIVAKIEELFTKLDAGVEALKKIKAELKRYRQAVLKHAFEGELTAEWREKNRDKLESASKLLERIKKEREKCTKGKEKKLPPLETTDLPELPDGWEWAQLGEISKFKNGINFTKAQKGDKGILTIDVLNMYSKNLWVDSDNLYRVNKKPNDEYILQYGDILFVRSSVKREGVGWASLFKKMNEPATFCGFIIRARLFDVEFSSEYLTYFLRSDTARKDIVGSSSQVTITNINQNALGRITIPLCSAIEQNQIVSEIDHHFSIADQIEQTIEQGLKQSNRLRQSILKKAFEGKLVPQDPEDEPAEKLLERIKAEKAKAQDERKVRKKTTRKSKKKVRVSK